MTYASKATFPLRDFIKLELQILIHLRGGPLQQMRSSDVYAPLAERFNLDEEARLLTRDEYYGDGNSGSAWANLVQYARRDLVDDGCFDPYAPHGIWRLTPKGAEEARILVSIRERTARHLRQLIEKGDNPVPQEGAGPPLGVSE